MYKILITVVCRGNIARSPVAETLIHRKLEERNLLDKYEVISRGVQGTKVDPTPVRFPNITYYHNLYYDAKPALEDLKIDLSKHISRTIDEEIMKKSDVVLAMDSKTLEGLNTLFPDFKDKVHLFSEIANKKSEFKDPETLQGVEKHRKVFNDIKLMIDIGFNNLLKLININ